MVRIIAAIVSIRMSRLAVENMARGRKGKVEKVEIETINAIGID